MAPKSRLQFITPAQKARIATMQSVVAALYGYTDDDLKGHRKTKQLAIARHVAMWLVRKTVLLSSITGRRTPISFQDVASLFDRNQHDSALYAFQKVEEMRAQDLPFRVRTNTLLFQWEEKPDNNETAAK